MLIQDAEDAMTHCQYGKQNADICLQGLHLSLRRRLLEYFKHLLIGLPMAGGITIASDMCVAKDMRPFATHGRLLPSSGQVVVQLPLHKEDSVSEVSCKIDPPLI